MFYFAIRSSKRGSYDNVAFAGNLKSHSLFPILTSDYLIGPGAVCHYKTISSPLIGTLVLRLSLSLTIFSN